MKQKIKKEIRFVAKKQLATRKQFRKWARKGVGKRIYSDILSAQKEARRNFSQKLKWFKEEMEWQRREKERRQGQRYWWQYP